MVKISKYLSSFKIGSAELLLALTPVFAQFGIGIIHLDMFMCLLVSIICYFRRQEKWCPKYYHVFVSFIVIHEIILCATIPNFQMSHINSLINMMVFMFTIIIVAPAIDFVQFKRASYVVAFIASLGILYQVRMVMSGSLISPLPIPIMDSIFERDGQNLLLIRPMSFFPEPSAYALFMIVPLFFLLTEKRYIWFGAAVVCVLLSTSTTGVAGCISLLILYMLLNAKHKGSIILIALLLGGIGYALNNLEEFSQTKDKIDHTDASTNSRTSNGPRLVLQLNPVEHIVGVNASNIQDYVQEHKELLSNITTFGESDNFYVSSLWLILIKFGIIGFVLYYYVFYRLLRCNIHLLPFIGTVVAVSFFGGIGISHHFSFMLISAIAFVMYEKNYSKIKW